MEDISKLLFDTAQSAKDGLTYLFHLANEDALKDTPVDKRPSDPAWDDHWKEYLERDLFKFLFEQKGKQDMENQKNNTHERKYPPITGRRG